MPTTFYTEDEYKQLQREAERLQSRVDALEFMRPQWAQGHTSDSIAAQVSASALQQLWGALGVTNQTAAMQHLAELKRKRS